MVPDLTIESHWNQWSKNPNVNGQTTEKHSMVMVSSKTIEHCNDLSKTIEIIYANGGPGYKK